MSDLAPQTRIDELLDRAFKAISEGDHATASVLAEQVLSIDHGNADAEDLLAAPVDHGEIRRLTLLFADLVDSTALSTRIEPETYRTAVGRYKERVREIIDRYGGHIGSTKGDGLLVRVRSSRRTRERRRAARFWTGLDIAREVGTAQRSDQAPLRFRDRGSGGRTPRRSLTSTSSRMTSTAWRPT